MLALALTACGTDEADDPPSTPAAACSAVLDDRDPTVVGEAQDASIEILYAVVQGSTPSQADLGTWSEQLQAGRDQLDEEVERLREVADSPGWDAVLAPLEEQAAIYGERIELAEGDWPVDEPADLLTNQGASEDTAAALEELGLVGRDCESLPSYPGPAPEARGFVSAAAQVCSGVVERRAANDYDAASDANLDLVAQLFDGETPEATDESVGALTDLHEEWERTAEELGAARRSTAAIPTRSPRPSPRGPSPRRSSTWRRSGWTSATAATSAPDPATLPGTPQDPTAVR